MAGLGKQMRGNGIAQVQRQEFKKGGKAFPDLNEDGEITRADVLKGRGVPGFKKGGYADMSEKHEGMESKAEEAKEYAMEDKGYKETKSGKMVKAAKGGSIKKDTHITKDGRVAKKGLYYYMNRAKKLGKSKPGKGTVSDKALKASAKTAKK